MRAIIGIDPGYNGAIALISENGVLRRCIDTPMINADTYNEDEMALIICDAYITSDNLFGYIEDTLTPVYRTRDGKKGQNVKSVKMAALGLGIWRGIFSGLGIKYKIVHPKTWESIAFSGLPKKMSNKDKGKSRLVCEQVFPDLQIDVEGKFLDGRADAALIARYGWEKQNGQTLPSH
jgi:hypothetical protein